MQWQQVLRPSRRVVVGGLALWLAAAPVRAEERADAPPQGIFNYMARPEPDFAWTVKQSRTTENGTIHEIELVSQKWQGIVWKHALMVYEPVDLVYSKHVLLFVTGGKIGGRPKDEDMAMALGLAKKCGGRVAFLHQTPNQPLMGDRVEDDLITETWLRYLETGDETWPLLFPMVKSAVKAMDAIEAFVEQQSGARPEGFVITGASKRGWTSWLTPVVDKRVIATAPIVINTLNFPAQMKHQIETWGAYSEQIEDYTSKGLVRAEGEPQTPREEHLWRMMDPYTYREQLTLPKLMIVGANDRYWVLDAMNLYWDGLSGPKYTLQAPNAGHGLDGERENALTTLAVYFRHQASGTALPELSWTYSDGGDGLHLRMQADPPPDRVRLWTATSTTKDFRESKWTASDMSGSAGDHSARLPKPASGHIGLFGEYRFRFDGIEYSLSTQAYQH